MIISHTLSHSLNLCLRHLNRALKSSTIALHLIPTPPLHNCPVHVCVHMYIQTYPCIHICEHTNTHTCKYACTYKHTHKYAYTYAYTNINTYINTNIPLALTWTRVVMAISLPLRQPDPHLPSTFRKYFFTLSLNVSHLLVNSCAVGSSRTSQPPPLLPERQTSGLLPSIVSYLEFFSFVSEQTTFGQVLAQDVFG